MVEQMAAKCSIESSRVLAAVCSNSFFFFLDTTYRPREIFRYCMN